MKLDTLASTNQIGTEFQFRFFCFLMLEVVGYHTLVLPSTEKSGVLEAVDATQVLQKLSQIDERSFTLSNGDGPWTRVSDSWYEEGENHGDRYAAFAQPSYRSKVLEQAGWDLTKGRGVRTFLNIMKMDKLSPVISVIV